MGAVIEIRDYGHPRGLRVTYVASRSYRSQRLAWTTQYRHAARFADDELADEVQYWRDMLADPNVDVAVVE